MESSSAFLLGRKKELSLRASYVQEELQEDVKRGGQEGVRTR
ncbi:hypothetical protein ACT7DG_19960 [Bacillus cereus]